MPMLFRFKFPLFKTAAAASQTIPAISRYITEEI